MREEQESKLNKVVIWLVVIGFVAVAGLVLGILLPNKTVDDAISYDTISPYVRDYLDRNNLLNPDGTLTVPSTGGGDNGDDALTISVGYAIEKLLEEGKLDYLKGEKGDTGATGKAGATGATGAKGEQGIPGSYAGKGDKGDKGDTGAAGAAGVQGAKGDKGDKGDTGATGATGAAGQDGLDGLVTAVDSVFAVSGGTLSLKPCAVDQVLAFGGSSAWECATVTASGVGGATNVSATLALSGTQLTSTITDSDGNTISTTPLDLDPTFATDAELAAAITAIDLSNYVTVADYSALADRVTTLETKADDLDAASIDHAGRISALESAGANYATTSALSTALSNYYLKTETYSKSEADNFLADKQEALPACIDGQVVKYDATSSQWLCATDNAGQGATDLTGYATEAWVGQNYATRTALNALLTSNLVAGAGVTLTNNDGVITINATGATNVFEVVDDHTAVVVPDANKIYIDTATNPDSQWVYHNNTWQQVGEVNADLANYYTKTQTDSAITSAIASNNGNYTTTAALTSLLAGKQDKLPNCAAGQVVKYSLTAPHWDCAADNDTTYNLSSYATQSWVASQNFVTSSALTGYYTKTEVDQKVDDKITGSGGVTKIEMVTTLPASQDPNTVYMLVEP